MADLNSLKAQFMSLQKKSSFKLSERTVIEIINKIANRGKINLLHTINGKEYVVNEKVDIEIINLIKKEKKIPIAEISKTLEIPINIIEKKLETILKKNKNFIEIEGKIITNDYLNKMTSDVNSILKHESNVTFSFLSSKYELPIPFIKNFFTEKIDSKEIKNAKLYPTRIITDHYIEIQTKRIRPALLSVITPINISSIISDFDIDEMLVNEIIEDLISKGELKGKFISNIYESDLYYQSQMNYIKGEMDTNKYIDYEKLKIIGINTNGKEYLLAMSQSENENPLTKSLKEGVFLKEFFISEEFKKNFEISLNECIDKMNGVNLNSIFFFYVDEEDSATLLESCNIPNDTFKYINENLLPSNIGDNYLLSIKEKVKEIALKEYDKYAELVSKGEENKEIEEDLKDEEEEIPKKGKSKGKKKSSNNPKKGINFELDNSYLDEFKKEFENLPSIDDLNKKHETLNSIFDDKIVDGIKELYSSFMKEFIKSNAGKEKTVDSNNLGTLVNNDYIYLKLVEAYFLKNEQSISSDNFTKNMKTLIAYLSKKDLSIFLKNLLIFQMIHMKLKLSNNKLSNYNERRDLIGIIPDDDIREAFNEMNEDIQERKFYDFMNEITNKKKILAATLDPFEKKKEKEETEKFLKELSEKIKSKVIGEKGPKIISFNDFISFVCDVCGHILGKKGFIIKPIYEVWMLGIYKDMFNEGLFKNEELSNTLDSILNILNTKPSTGKGKKKTGNINYEENYSKNQEELNQLANDVYEFN